MIPSPSQEVETNNFEMLVDSDFVPDASYPQSKVGQSGMSFVHSFPQPEQDWSILGQQPGYGKRWIPKKDSLSNMSTDRTDTAMRKRKLSCDTMSLSSSVSRASRRRRKIENNGNKPARIPMVDDNSCQLPLALQQILNEEQAYITKSGIDDSECGTPRPVRRLHALPATVTVHQVLDHFVNRAMDDEEGVVRRQFCQTLEALFHKVLVQQLLYPEEVPQHRAVQQQEQQPPSHIYGCSFLLRLLVRLPHYTAFPKSECLAFAGALPPRLSPLVGDLVMLLQRNRLVCFRHDAYRPPSYEELLGWEQELVKDSTKWIVQQQKKEEEEEEQHDTLTCGGEDSMVLTTPTKQNSAY